ncbi:hypothetical protein ACFQYP_25490 [Nonomuraea antimicrobica]
MMGHATVTAEPADGRRNFSMPPGGRMSRPLIGITSYFEAARWGDWVREAVLSPPSYAKAVGRAGARRSWFRRSARRRPTTTYAG